MTLRALCDANVLYPVYLRDVIGESGVSGLFRPLWSDGILDETQHALSRTLPEAGEKFPKIRGFLLEALPDSLVEVPREPVHDFGCWDPDDNLIVAAAVAGKADVLVTFNIRDFPADLFERCGIALATPDEFLSRVFWENEELASLTVSNLLESYVKANIDVKMLAERLHKAGCPNLSRLISLSG